MVESWQRAFQDPPSSFIIQWRSNHHHNNAAFTISASPALPSLFSALKNDRAHPDSGWLMRISRQFM